MRKGRKRVSTPSPETLWDLGYDSFRSLALTFRDMGPNAWQDPNIVSHLCDGAVESLVDKLEKVPVAQRPMAFLRILVAMLVCAAHCHEFVEGKDEKAPKRPDHSRSA